MHALDGNDCDLCNDNLDECYISCVEVFKLDIKKIVTKEALEDGLNNCIPNIVDFELSVDDFGEVQVDFNS